MARKKVEKIKRKKKVWFQLKAPKILSSQVIGETPSYTPESLIGKRVQVNLSTITNDMKKQNTSINLDIYSVHEHQADCFISGTNMANAYVKRLARRGREKIDDSFVVTTKDAKKIRVKPLIITNGKTSNSIQTKIRLAAREYIAELAKNSNAEQVFDKIINIRLQKELKENLSKIYPLKFSHIKEAKLEGKYTYEAPADEEVTEEKTEKEKKPAKKPKKENAEKQETTEVTQEAEEETEDKE